MDRCDTLLADLAGTTASKLRMLPPARADGSAQGSFLLSASHLDCVTFWPCLPFEAEFSWRN